VDLVREALNQLESMPVYRRAGKFEILVFPNHFGAYQDDKGSGVVVPAGFEYALTQASLYRGEDGHPGVRNVWGIAWRTINPQGWIRSVLESLRKAGQQLPIAEPGLIYIQVPPGSFGVVQARIEILVPYVLNMLAGQDLHRVNCVVLTGSCYRQASPNEDAVMTSAYRPLYNRLATLQLPEGFQILGDHFTRT
jgi:hypothetical protein